VHIHAMYKDRFTKGMTVVVQPPDGVAAFDPVEVGCLRVHRSRSSFYLRG
jgi:hypothetical protein